MWKTCHIVNFIWTIYYSPTTEQRVLVAYASLEAVSDAFPCSKTIKWGKYSKPAVYWQKISTFVNFCLKISASVSAFKNFASDEAYYTI